MSKVKILVADDEFVMREGIREALLNIGYDADLARDGAEAIRLIEDKSYAMIITDVKMPKADGMEVLKAAKKVYPDVPVLVMTAYGTVNNAVEAMKFGAYDYILKPFSTEAIEEAVMNALSREGERGNLQGHGHTRIITENKKMNQLLGLAENVAKSDATVLLFGESGTGKELIARYIHEKSDRSNGPFVAVNCAALPEQLLESELFGHEKGAFTGAVSQRSGKFELANGGTLLLDEISEMDMILQAKLLRVLQERVVDRVGSTKPVPVDIRVIATTNRDMKERVRDGHFREDLYYRLNVFPFNVPPLRERTDDIELLSRHFAKKYYKGEKGFTSEAMRRLETSVWKGNVRELENIIQRAILLSGDGDIEESHLFFNEEDDVMPDRGGSLAVGMSVREAEKELIFKTLEEYQGNRSKAASILGISARTLRNKLKEYELCHEDDEEGSEN